MLTHPQLSHRIDPLDMRTGPPDIDHVPRHPSLLFRFLDLLLHRERRAVQVDDQTLVPAFRFRHSQTHYPQLAALGRLADQSASLVAAQIQADDEILPASQGELLTPSTSSTPTAMPARRTSDCWRTDDGPPPGCDTSDRWSPPQPPSCPARARASRNCEIARQNRCDPGATPGFCLCEPPPPSGRPSPRGPLRKPSSPMPRPRLRPAV